MTRMHIQRRLTRGGFTLIELLVVIAIIVTLISILMPALNQARESARSAKCAANLRQICMASHFYSQDYQGKFPRGGSTHTASSGWPGIAFFDGWVAQLMVYTNDARMEDARRANNQTFGIWDCPDNWLLYGNGGMSGNYLYNSEAGYNFNTSTGVNISKPMNWPDPASKILFADAGNDSMPYNGLPGVFSTTRNWSIMEAGYNRRYAVGAWHNGKYNAAFVDGHVSAEKLDGTGQIAGAYFPQWLIWQNRW